MQRLVLPARDQVLVGLIQVLQRLHNAAVRLRYLLVSGVVVLLNCSPPTQCPLLMHCRIAQPGCLPVLIDYGVF